MLYEREIQCQDPEESITFLVYLNLFVVSRWLFMCSQKSAPCPLFSFLHTFSLGYFIIAVDSAIISMGVTPTYVHLNTILDWALNPNPPFLDISTCMSHGIWKPVPNWSQLDTDPPLLQICSPYCSLCIDKWSFPIPLLVSSASLSSPWSVPSSLLVLLLL